MSSWAGRRPVVAFVLLATAITWGTAPWAHSLPVDTPLSGGLWLLSGAGPSLTLLAAAAVLGSGSRDRRRTVS